MAITLQELETVFKGNDRDLKRAYRDVERDTESHVSKVNRILGRIANPISQFNKALKGGNVGDAGILASISHISNIIQGISFPYNQVVKGLIDPLTDAAQAGIQFNMILETSKIAFEGIAGSADKASAHVQKLMAFGQKTPFRFEGLLEASQLMTAFGFSLDEQIPKLTTWGNAIAAGGNLSEEAVLGVVTAMGQMASSGRVNAMDMMQLTTRMIPAWELLAKAIGKSIPETRKLSEEGKLNGKAAMEAITAMMAIEPRFKDTMKRMSGTLAGRLSEAGDVLQFGQGKATETLTKDISETIGAALENQNIVGQIATYVNTAIAPVSGLIKGTVKTVLGGGITLGLTDAFEAAKSILPSSIMNMATEGILTPFKNILGIKSPSTVFYEYGQMAALGFHNGFQDGLKRFSSAEDVAAWVKSLGYHVTSTIGGDHNPGSRHKEGLAVDVRTKDRTDADIETLIKLALSLGLLVRDERVRPDNQKEWSAPHVHLEVDTGKITQEQMSRGTHTTSPSLLGLNQPTGSTVVPVRIISGVEELYKERDAKTDQYKRQVAEAADRAGIKIPGINQDLVGGAPVNVRVTNFGDDPRIISEAGVESTTVAPEIRFTDIEWTPESVRTFLDRFNQINAANLVTNTSADQLGTTIIPRIIDGVNLWAAEVERINTGTNQAADGAGKWAKRVVSGGETSQWKRMGEEIEQIFGNSFSQIDQGWRAVTDSMLMQFSTMLARMAAQRFAEWIVGLVGGILGGAAGAASGGSTVGGFHAHPSAGRMAAPSIGSRMAPATAGTPAVINNYFTVAPDHTGSVPKQTERQIKSAVMKSMRGVGGG